MQALRQTCPEPRALELFQALTAYPVTDNLTHVCRQCQTSVLFQALHTLEHTVLMRYPSLALGDQADLGTYTTLGHYQTGAPTIFWFDDYEGGMGAAEKVYDKILPLIEAGAGAVSDCACRSLEGCPRCTQIGHCDSGNQQISKPALLALAGLLLGRAPMTHFSAYSYRANRGEEFNRAYNRNEFAGEARGIGEEALPGAPLRFDPYQILRVQPSLHAPVLHKAFEVRSGEISEDVPPVSAVELNQAYQQVLGLPLAGEWNIRPGLTPYQVLELLPAASPKMVQQVYRVIARLVHPDANPANPAWANEMMKLVNAAYDRIMSESGK
jgi:hypothetical protein